MSDVVRGSAEDIFSYDEAMYEIERLRATVKRQDDEIEVANKAMSALGKDLARLGARNAELTAALRGIRLTTSWHEATAIAAAALAKAGIEK